MIQNQKKDAVVQKLEAQAKELRKTILTMIHEAMVLDYSGPQLALIELASHIRQIFWITLLAIILLPSFSLFALIAAIIFICIAIAFIEVGIAKFRLFKVPDLLMFGFILALLSVAVGLLKI